ncbi:AAA family ATPase [Caballeronia sp. LZ032]|uniref:AAA family ATPase n=1 Tax=Caballeronia sp. LZ032 TaxID=3038565 RepID=UPI002861ED68|nr:AAA family ATPase [Caballeronia sp. LZ032]MDR5880420.1 AAA family ATPase [Caballeronia sp. LZ032]
MLVGLFLRHYKVYKNINFIPITTGAGLAAFLGQNGVGKSSILDALDKFFNGGDWSINAQAKSEGGISTEDKLPYIVPVFLIEKGLLSGSEEATATIISDHLWSTALKTTDALTSFYALRGALAEKGYSRETHLLVAIGRQHNRWTAYLGSFHTDSELSKAMKAAEKSQLELNTLLDKISERYAYFYIPVEADPTVFSKLESTHVQKLLDEDIQGTIREAIGHKTINTINSSLQNFVNQISDSLSEYRYKGTFKDKLTMNDLVEKVFEAYFSIKVLHKVSSSSSIPIREMSAGEKRRALIDLSYSLLRRNADRKHNIVLAIDEPDASLHNSACHELFSKLSEIPDLTSPASQVLLTTHWYGFLPVVQKGVAHSITEGTEKNEFFTFDLYNFREQIKQAVKSSNGELPRDIELKSYNDMLQAIVSSTVRPQPYNWILCEGLSDKIYLDFYLKDLVESHNLRIIPLGGFKEVRRAFTYLKTPLDDPEYKVKGRVLCLVDTDAQLEHVPSKPESKSIDFLRLIYDTERCDVKLVKIDDQLVSPSTEIEHALEGDRFVKTVDEIGAGSGGASLKEIVSATTIVAAASCAYAYLDLAPSANKRMMAEYFDVADNKVKFAQAYVRTGEGSSSPPEWVRELRDHFLPPIKKKKR